MYNFSGPEVQILDYTLQQHKLFPILASYFAFKYAAEALWNMYHNVHAEMQEENFENLPEVL